ncbi:hypothetical protein NPX13_g4939 [Xylaria arbuscula]|uniref:Uncharacterized protein n=1 Tax=Xylaria arbuscula TaxID=114810 RepID=A0A9W8NFD7_9PEZI|nr:hypothetical protein NPX13_g4939 [Xylaria arbuscula]
MAADQGKKELALTQLLGSTSFDERQANWDKFQAQHTELSNEDSKISPRNFKLLFDEHLLQILKVRAFLVEQLNNIWSSYGALDLSENTKREELKVRGEAAVKARNQYDGLLKNIIIVAAGCAERVNWEKHSKNNYQAELLGWVIQRQARLTGFISDPSNERIRTDLEAVHSCLTPLFKALSSKSEIQTEKRGNSTIIKIKTKKLGVTAQPTNTPTPPFTLKIEEGGEKHPLGDVGESGDAAGSSKKPKLTIPVGQWWGPNNSRLSCTDEFFDVVREFRAYVANPTEEVGTMASLAKMGDFVKGGLQQCGMRDRFEDLLMRKQWNFRDRTLKHPTAPTMIQPGVAERYFRLGENGNVGVNHFKKILGGGLTDYELEEKNHRPPVQGLLSLAHAATIDDRVGLRGGWDWNGQANEPGTPAYELLTAIREAIPLRWRDPSILWQQLVEDATFPEVNITARAKEERPLMTDPSWVGQPTPLSHFRNMMSTIVDADEWAKFQGEIDYSDAEEMLHRYWNLILTAKRNIDDFVHANDELNWEEPKLNEPGGKDKPKRRYGNIRDKEFAKPIGDAFRYRMYQLFRLELTWQSYLAGSEPLLQLLHEEKALLEAWDAHEMLYMEWENCRWFTLSNPMAIAQLENRYSQREILRKKWADERKAIDATLNLLSIDEDHFVRAGEALLTKKEKAMKATEAAKAKFPDDSGIATLLDSGVLDKGEGDKNTHGEAMAVDQATLLQDIDNFLRPDQPKSTDVNMGGVDNYQDPPDLDAAQKYFEKLIDIYQKELEQSIHKNQKLDKDDIGNTSRINLNNVDIMAKEQMIWALRSELDNLQRSLDPMADKNIGRGVSQKWPAAPDFTKNITPLPRKRDLPLGVTSLGLGPMPGEHPAPDHPSVLLGCPPGFAEPRQAKPRPLPNTSMMTTPTPNAGVSPPEQAVIPTVVGSATKSRDNTRASTGLGISNVESWSYEPWREFLQLHNDTWRKDESNGTALLGWDEWINEAYQALRQGSGALRPVLASSSDFKTDESLLHHVRDQYVKRFHTVERHNDMPWRQRELERRFLLTSFSRSINSLLKNHDKPQTFPKLGPLPQLDSAKKLYPTPSPEMSKASLPEKNTQVTLTKLRELLKTQNEHEVTIRKLTRAESKGATLCAKDQRALATANKMKADTVAAYNTLRGGLDVSGLTQARSIEQEERAILQQEIKTVEALVDARINKNQITPSPSPSPSKPAVSGKPEAPCDPNAPKLPSNTDELARATELLAAARNRLRESRGKYNAAIDAEAAAEKEAAAHPNNRARRLSQQLAARKIEEVNKEYTESKLNMWLQSAAFLVQQNWLTFPHESLEQLKERYDDLTRDFDEWKADIKWDRYRPDEPAFTVSHWIVNVIVMMSEAYKGVSVNMPPELFQEMYDYFWEVPAKTLERKRRIYLWEIVNKFHKKIEECGCPGGQFVTLGPKPPQSWIQTSPSREELIYPGEAKPMASKAKQKAPSHAFQASHSAQQATVEDVTDSDDKGKGMQQFALSSKNFAKPSVSVSPSKASSQDLQDRLKGFKMESLSPSPLPAPQERHLQQHLLQQQHQLPWPRSSLPRVLPPASRTS